MSEATTILTALEIIIQDSQAGRLSLPALSTELEIGIQSLPSSLEKIKEALFSRWIAIEEMNALALDSRKHLPLPEHEEIFKKALNEMSDLVAEAQKTTSDG